jgi:hypothetical protein
VFEFKFWCEEELEKEPAEELEEEADEELE